MWIRDLRAVAFSGSCVFRSPRPDALRLAVLTVATAQAPEATDHELAVAWSRYEAERARVRWSSHREFPIESFLREVVRDETVDEAVDAVAERLGADLEWQKDALPTFDYLRESGYGTVVLVDLPVPLPVSWRERCRPWIDEIVSSRDLSRRTPDPAAFHECLRRLHLSRHQLLHVGEGAVEDVYAAQNVGLRTALLERFGRGRPDPDAAAWLLREHDLDVSSVKPDLKLRKLEDLPAAIDTFG